MVLQYSYRVSQWSCYGVTVVVTVLSQKHYCGVKVVVADPRGMHAQTRTPILAIRSYR
jgi:hypothetical protein